jgi:hypothetical protein
MKESDRICHKVKLMGPKDREAYIKRDENYI